MSADVAKDEAKQAAVYRFLAFYFGQEGSSILFDNSNIPIATYADLQMENTNPGLCRQSLRHWLPAMQALQPATRSHP